MSSPTYNLAFLVGAGYSLILWCIVFLIDYEVALQAANSATRISFSGGNPGIDWGFPFEWTNAGGVCANIVIIALSTIAIGHIFRSIQERYFPDWDQA